MFPDIKTFLCLKVKLLREKEMSKKFQTRTKTFPSRHNVPNYNNNFNNYNNYDNNFKYCYNYIYSNYNNNNNYKNNYS